MAGIQLQTIPNSSRVHRRPRHKFALGIYPYRLVPFLLAPVWPGESLVNLWFETREVSPPLVDPITGWGSEWYVFYVKMSDLVAHPEVMTMLIDPNNTPLTGSGHAYDDAPYYYHKGPFPNYGFMCMERVVETYFRDVAETPHYDEENVGVFEVKYRDHGLFDSLTPGAFDDGSAVPPAASGMDDLARAQDLYDYLVAAQLTDLSYSDWCAAYGVKIPAAEKNEPELLFNFKEWVYPSNTVNPADGTPSSAISLVLKKNFNEPKYFKEPGFIFGCHVLRPKLYSLDQKQNAVDLLNTALAWLPAMLSSDPATSLREFTASDILTAHPTPTDKVIVDMRDVPMYGDQLFNTTLPVTAVNMDPALAYQYPLSSDVTALFKAPGATTTKADGFTSLDIVGRIVDYTTAHTSAL